MAGIRVKVGESIDRALRQFKRQCIDSGLMIEMKKRIFYEKPSEIRRRQEKKRVRTIKYATAPRESLPAGRSLPSAKAGWRRLTQRPR